MSMNDTDKWASQIINELFDKPKFESTPVCSEKADGTSSNHSDEELETFFSPLEKNLDRQEPSVMCPDCITGSLIKSGSELLISSFTNNNVSQIYVNSSDLSLSIKQDSKLPVTDRFHHKIDERCQTSENSITVGEISDKNHDIINCIESTVNESEMHAEITSMKDDDDTNGILHKQKESAESSSHFNNYEGTYAWPCHSNFTKMNLDQNIGELHNAESKEEVSNISKMSKSKDETSDENIIKETDEMVEFMKQKILKNRCLNDDDENVKSFTLFMEDDKEIDSEICSEIHRVCAEENATMQSSGSNCESDHGELSRSGNIPSRDQQVDKIQRRINNSEMENSFSSVTSNYEDFISNKYESFAENRFKKEMILFPNVGEKIFETYPCDKADRELQFEVSNKIPFFSDQENIPNQQDKTGGNNSRKDRTVKYTEATGQQLVKSKERINNNKNRSIFRNVPNFEEPEESGGNSQSDTEIIETKDLALKCETVLKASDGDKNDIIPNKNRINSVESKNADDWYKLLKNISSISPRQRKEEIMCDDEIISQRAFIIVIIYRIICLSFEEIFLIPLTMCIVATFEWLIFVFFMFVRTGIFVYERIKAFSSYAFQQLMNANTSDALQWIQKVFPRNVTNSECDTRVLESQGNDQKGFDKIEIRLNIVTDEIDACKDASPLNDITSFITILPEKVFLNIIKNGQVKHSLEDMYEKVESYTLQEEHRSDEVAVYENAPVCIITKEDTIDAFNRNGCDLPISESLKAGGSEKPGSEVTDSCQLRTFSKIVEDLPSEDLTWEMNPKRLSQNYGSWSDFKNYLSAISGAGENNILSSTEIDCSRLERGEKAPVPKSDLDYLSRLDSNMPGVVAEIYTASLDSVTADTERDKNVSMDVNLSCCSSVSELDMTLNTTPLLNSTENRFSESRLWMRSANSNELSVIFDSFQRKQSTSLGSSLVNFVPVNSNLLKKYRSLDDKEKLEQLWMRPANDAEIARLFDRGSEKRSKSLNLPLTGRISEVPYSEVRNKSDNTEIVIDSSNKELCENAAEEHSIIESEDCLHVSSLGEAEYSNEFCLTLPDITDAGQENSDGSPENSFLYENSRNGSQIFHIATTSTDETDVVEDGKNVPKKRSNAKLRRRMSQIMSSWKSLNVMNCVVGNRKSHKKYKKHSDDAGM